MLIVGRLLTLPAPAVRKVLRSETPRTSKLPTLVTASVLSAAINNACVHNEETSVCWLTLNLPTIAPCWGLLDFRPQSSINIASLRD